MRHHERFWPYGVPDIADDLFWIILERFRTYLVIYGDSDVHFLGLMTFGDALKGSAPERVAYSDS